jgi:hypothetical protein
MSSESGRITHCLGLANFYFFWSFIRQNLGCSHFFIRFFKKCTTFSKMEISISVKIGIPEIFIIIHQLNNPTQNGFLCKIVQRLVKIFFSFFQTLALFGHPKVENLVQDKVFFKSRLLKCGYFFYSIIFCNTTNIRI